MRGRFIADGGPDAQQEKVESEPRVAPGEQLPMTVVRV